MNNEHLVFRHGTSLEWTEKNPVLFQGEPGYETDSKRKKIGDGVTPWASLPYEDAIHQATVDVFQFEMPTAQTTAVVDHTLGRDPVAVQVLSMDGEQFSEFQVVITIPEKQVTVGFDIPVQALIRVL